MKIKITYDSDIERDDISTELLLKNIVHRHDDINTITIMLDKYNYDGNITLAQIKSLFSSSVISEHTLNKVKKPIGHIKNGQ